MSLINDALKQIKQTRQQNPPPSPSQLSPVESDSPEGFGWLVLGIVVLLIAGAGIFVGVSLSKSTPVAARAMPAKTHLVPVNVSVTRQLQSATVPPTVARETGRVAATNKRALSDANPVVVSSKPPDLKLQGILFAATRPCAIVNGRTVFVNDHVNGFRVAMISRDSVTLRNETATRVLSLNPQ